LAFGDSNPAAKGLSNHVPNFSVNVAYFKKYFAMFTCYVKEEWAFEHCNMTGRGHGRIAPWIAWIRQCPDGHPDAGLHPFQ